MRITPNAAIVAMHGDNAMDVASLPELLPAIDRGRRTPPLSSTTPPPTTTTSARDDGRHRPAPHLFLHFDVNETILIGDPAGGDSVEECLNKVIAKSAFVSTKIGGSNYGDGNNSDEEMKRSPSRGNVPSIDSTHDLEPTHWWNGLPLPSSSGENDNDGKSNDGESGAAPPPLHTGWVWPPHACPYYRTHYKKFAKRFTECPHGSIYRPLYERLRSKLGSDHHDENDRNGEPTAAAAEEADGEKGGKQQDVFANFIPAFFHALQHYFPSTSGSPGSDDVNSNHGSASSGLPPPSKATLVLRTFGTDLPLVAKCISEFATGNHPSYPDYYNADLILEEGELLRSGWTHRDPGDNERRELIYELRPSGGKENEESTISGDDEVLNYLQSKTIVGIQDCYPFWRKNDYAPWSGKPVWARTAAAGHDHHHVLLDDNIHNDPNDGAGGIRIPVVVDTSGDATTSTTSYLVESASYDSLHGTDAFDMHGKHLIRVPTIRPLLEDDWFVRQIEEARRRVLGEDERDEKPSDTTLVLSNRNLSEMDFDRDYRFPPDLNSVDLSRNRLKSIPSQIFDLANLTRLDVSRNAIQGFPPEIGRLANLVELIALSNHLRLRQLPLEELASLKDLRMLDLRYNRKLKQSALTTLRDALGKTNPNLEIRCTVPSPSAEHEGAERKKLSACDRDATLLRSQLEPLSTPQLAKRLERSFGVALDENAERAYDREFVMTELLKRYEEAGPREVRSEKGIPVSRDRLAALRAELDAVPWPKTTRERPKIRAERYVILQRPGSGEADSARTRKEAAKLARYERLFDLAVETLAEVDAKFAKAFTALAVTKNFVGSPHIDTLNVGPFYGLSLGDFNGGGAIAVECSPFVVAEVDTRGRLGRVDGRFPHWVTPYEGTRYSLIYYVTSGSVEPQTTAIFAPPPGSNGAEGSAPWIPPPTYVP